MVQLWRMFSPGMGVGYLPDDGGMLDQAAVMIDAFQCMSAAASEIEKEYGKGH